MDRILLFKGRHKFQSISTSETENQSRCIKRESTTLECQVRIANGISARNGEYTLIVYLSSNDEGMAQKGAVKVKGKLKIEKPRRLGLPFEEKWALLEFFDSTLGNQWYNKDNWGNGDPCLNKWFGVYCWEVNENTGEYRVFHM